MSPTYCGSAGDGVCRPTVGKPLQTVRTVRTRRDINELAVRTLVRAGPFSPYYRRRSSTGRQADAIEAGGNCSSMVAESSARVAPLFDRALETAIEGTGSGIFPQQSPRRFSARHTIRNWVRDAMRGSLAEIVGSRSDLWSCSPLVSPNESLHFTGHAPGLTRIRHLPDALRVALSKVCQTSDFMEL